MKVTIEIDTREAGDREVLAALLLAFADDLPEDDERCQLPDNLDRSNGPLKDVDPKSVRIFTTSDNAEAALEKVNLADDVTEVALNTLPGDKDSEDVKLPVKEGKVEKPKKATKKAKEAANAAKEVVEEVKEVEAVVDVETPKAKVENATVNEALDQIDPKKPKEEDEVDHAAELRKLMVEVVKVHGAAGAKIASQVVNKIAGVKDVTKIPADKFEAVQAGLKAALVPDGEAEAHEEPEPPKEEPAAEPDESQDLEPSADDVDF